MLLAIYGGLIVVLMIFETKFIFHPTTQSQGWREAPTSIHAEDVTWPLPNGNTIHGWWCKPEGWTPDKGAMIYCHGNAGNLSHRAEKIRLFHRSLGKAVLIFDYPGYGKSTGKPNEQGCYDAAEAAFQWLTEQQQVKPESVVIAGTSLGGGVAIELAIRHPHRALLLVSTFTSIPDMASKQFPWLPLKPFIRNRFENLDKIVNCKSPIFFAHGTADTLIPFQMSETLFNSATARKQLYRMTDLNHNDPPDEGFYLAFNSFLNSEE